MKDSAQSPSGADRRWKLALWLTVHRLPKHSSPDSTTAGSAILTFVPPSVFPKVEKHLMTFHVA